MTRSLAATTSNTSPSVPSASVKPQARASSLELDPARRPMATFTSDMPAASSESCRFCACVGAGGSRAGRAQFLGLTAARGVCIWGFGLGSAAGAAFQKLLVAVIM